MPRVRPFTRRLVIAALAVQAAAGLAAASSARATAESPARAAHPRLVFPPSGFHWPFPFPPPTSPPPTSPPPTSPPTTQPPPPPAGTYSFGVIGDTGYDASSVTKFLNVRTAMNKAHLSFAVHVGDILQGGTSCPDSVYTTNRDRFDGFTEPLVYTPGDNEWSDCTTDKLGRLAFLRQVFFPTNQSRGDPSMTLERQSSAYPENAIWHQGPVTFVTLHNVGPDNDAGNPAEFNPRMAANLAWMDEAFAEAKARGSAGIVLLSHANIGFSDASGRASKVGFKAYDQHLISDVQAWGKPVIYVHGDSHTFIVDHSTLLGTKLPNFTRVEVYGPSAQHWIKIDVNPASPSLFTIKSQ